MILIVCGLDRCGKTTLINNLRKNYFKSPDTLVIHSSAPPDVENKNEWEIDHYYSVFKTSKLLSRIGYDIIFDRFHLGAIVYGEKYRNADASKIYELEQHQLSGFEEIAIVLLTDNAEEVVKRDDGESNEKNIEDFEQTKLAFEKSLQNSVCKHKLLVNITENGGFVNTYSTVTKFLDEVIHAKSK